MFTGKDVFLLANTLIYPAKIAGFDDKHGRIFFPATIGMLHCYIILATKHLGHYQQKNAGFYIVVLHHSVGTEMNFTSKNRISTSRRGDFTRNGGEW